MRTRLDPTCFNRGGGGGRGPLPDRPPVGGHRFTGDVGQPIPLGYPSVSSAHSGAAPGYAHPLTRGVMASCAGHVASGFTPGVMASDASLGTRTGLAAEFALSGAVSAVPRAPGVATNSDGRAPPGFSAGFPGAGTASTNVAGASGVPNFQGVAANSVGAAAPPGFLAHPMPGSFGFGSTGMLPGYFGGAAAGRLAAPPGFAAFSCGPTDDQ